MIELELMLLLMYRVECIASNGLECDTGEGTHYSEYECYKDAHEYAKWLSEEGHMLVQIKFVRTDR